MKGILMKPDMIQAIIEGRKTQTRRIVKPEPANYQLLQRFCKPRYQVGEVYIKEAWQPMTHNMRDIATIQYKDGGWVERKCSVEQWKRAYYDSRLNAYSWQSPMMMPEWAARYFIMITDVRVERLQEIIEDDAKAEGVECTDWWFLGAGLDGKDHLRAFGYLWNSINKDYQWGLNPWVWVYVFRMKVPA